MVTFAFAVVMGMLCFAHDAQASEGPVVEVFMNPLARLGLAVVVMAAVESLKAWKWFADKALSHPLARSAMALVLSVPAGLAVWAGGATVEGAIGVLLTSWVGAMGLNGLLGAASNKV